MAGPGSERTRAERLRGLPKSADLMLEGALLPSGLSAREGGQDIEVWVAMWVEAESGLVRTTNVLDPAELPRFGFDLLLDAFADACSTPAMPGRPELPAVVRVADGEMWIGIRDELESLGVRVELVTELPALEAALGSLQNYVGAPGGPPPAPFSWKIGSEVLEPLYAAAASYARRRPWDWLDDDPPIAVGLGKSGPNARASTLYGCVLGAAGMVQGIAFYLTRAAFRRALDAGEDLSMTTEVVDELIEDLVARGDPAGEVPEDVLRDFLTRALGEMSSPGMNEVPMEDSMVVFFDPVEEMDPTYMEWLEKRNLPVASRELIPRFFRARASGRVSNLSAREARSMTLALEAVNAFMSRFQRRIRRQGEDEILEEMETQVTVGQGKDRQAVWVAWPGD